MNDTVRNESINAREGVNPNAVVEIYPSPGRILCMACVSAGMTLAGVFVVTLGGFVAQAIGVVGAAFFFLGVVVALRMTYLSLAKKPILRVGRDRIWFRYAFAKREESLTFKEIEAFVLADIAGIKHIMAVVQGRSLKTIPVNSGCCRRVQDLYSLLNERLEEDSLRKDIAGENPSDD